MNVANRANAALEFAQPSNNTGFQLISNGAKDIKGFSIMLAATVTTPSPKTFTVVAATDVFTSAAHGFKTGLKGQVSSSVTLPTGLVAVTDYFVVVIDANTYKLASSLANALLGTVLDITTTGTGTHTFTATALAGLSYKLQGSQDGINYADVPSAATGDASKSGSIAAAGNYMIEDVDPQYDYTRVAYTLTAGQISIVESILTKGT